MVVEPGRGLRLGRGRDVGAVVVGMLGGRVRGGASASASGASSSAACRRRIPDVVAVRAGGRRRHRDRLARRVGGSAGARPGGVRHRRWLAGSARTARAIAGWEAGELRTHDEDSSGRRRMNRVMRGQRASRRSGRSGRSPPSRRRLLCHRNPEPGDPQHGHADRLRPPRPALVRRPKDPAPASAARTGTRPAAPTIVELARRRPGDRRRHERHEPDDDEQPDLDEPRPLGPEPRRDRGDARGPRRARGRPGRCRSRAPRPLRPPPARGRGRRPARPCPTDPGEHRQERDPERERQPRPRGPLQPEVVGEPDREAHDGNRHGREGRRRPPPPTARSRWRPRPRPRATRPGATRARRGSASPASRPASPARRRGR